MIVRGNLAGMLSLTFLLLCGRLAAQDVSGTWQGKLQAGAGIRTVVKIEKADTGEWKGTFYAIDQTPQGVPLPSVTVQDGVVRFSIEMLHGQYEGLLAPDGQSIKGTWTQGQSWELDFQRATPETAWALDPSPHKVQMVAVEPDLKLEVLDWGGTGRPIVLLAGLGNTAHDFDRLAPKLAASYHVFGITRRGFGASSSPPPTPQNYSADRLGDDLPAVMDALKIERPVLVGHSIAGEELSSVGSRHPEKVAGLIYLDAGYSYAYYDKEHGDAILDALDAKSRLDSWLSGKGFDPEHFFPDLQATLTQLNKDIAQAAKKYALTPASMRSSADLPLIQAAITAGEKKYTAIPVPVLAIYAAPHNFDSLPIADAAAKAAMVAFDLENTKTQAHALEVGVPGARIVLLPNADHFVYESNEADVLREMNEFLATLK